jgi:hypothetical protein
MMNAQQKEFLDGAKKALEQRLGRMNWDEFAQKAGIEPRTMKSYRADPDSKHNYREMPSLVRQAIESLLQKPQREVNVASALVGALAGLVIRQAKTALVDRQIITGLSQYPGSRTGLSEEDRKAMALVSRAALQSGLADVGGEIHELLSACREPFSEWLQVPHLLQAGFGATVLIDPDHGIPTPEAQELAEAFGSIAAHLEERIFAAYKDALARFPQESAAEYYTLIREFVVRNPVASAAQLFEIGKKLPPVLWLPVQREFYEPFPASVMDTELVLCAHCNSLLKPHKNGARIKVCSSRACRNERPTQEGARLPALQASRVRAEIHQFWVEPGIHEVWLHDDLKTQGFDVSLYPHQDRVDVGISDDRIGIDLKAYASAETLGLKLKKSIGGLAFYEKKLLVIPDWIVRSQASYLERLRSAMGENSRRLTCCMVSEVASISKETLHA